jgi:hypothetical protein
MKHRAATLPTILLLGALPVCGADRVPMVVGVHRNPGDLRSICVVANHLVASTAEGGYWSAPIAAVVAAARNSQEGLTPSWVPPQFSGPSPCPEGTPPTPAHQLDGYAATARADLAGDGFTATFGGGLFRSSGAHVPSSPPEIHDLAVIDDLLVIAHTHGLAAFDGTTVTLIELSGPPVADITALEWVDDTLWAGSFDHGLAFYRMGRWEAARTIIEHGGDWINSLCWDGATLWVGSAAGLGRWDPGAGRVIAEPGVEGGVQSIRCDENEVLVATAAALWIGVDDRWEAIDLAGEALHTAVRHRRKLWAAGLRGILRRRGGGWERDTELNGRLPDSWITALLPDGGSIWAGTYDAGVLRLEGNGSWRTMVRDAWVNPNAMISTPGGVAIGTMGDGLLLYDRSTDTWLRLTLNSGLPSDDVTALKIEGDTLWVGTRAGIAEVRWLEP